MVSKTLFRATKSSAHTPLDNFCSVIEPLSSILQIQIQIDLMHRLTIEFGACIIGTKKIHLNRWLDR